MKVAEMWTATVLLLLILVHSSTSFTPDLTQISPAGHSVADLLDSLNVDNKWSKGVHIAWFSGEPNNPFAKYSVATHCSAFAHAVAERLGVYLLRPPNHGQGLLASPQHLWLQSAGQDLGWRLTTDLIELQYAANQGKLAVISKISLNISVPGHIGVVRPSSVYDTAFLLKNGPQLAQAGRFNSANISAINGFRPFFVPNVLYAIYDRAREPLAPLPATLWMAPPQATTAQPPSSNDTLSTSTTLYAVDLAPLGRIDVIRLSYSSKGAPVWVSASNSVAVANASAWVPWFTYSLPRSTSPPTGEPFLTRNSGSSIFGLSTSSSGKTQELSLMSQQGDGGTVPPVTLKADMTTSPVPGITGLWYAAVDNQFYGIFITKSTATSLFGYILLYSEGASNSGSAWRKLSANWTNTTSTAGTGTNTDVSSIKRSAIGYTEKCSLSVIKTKTTVPPVCSMTASNVVLDVDGNTASITGLALGSGLNTTDTVYILEKATVYMKN